MKRRTFTFTYADGTKMAISDHTLEKALAWARADNISRVGQNPPLLVKLPGGKMEEIRDTPNLKIDTFSHEGGIQHFKILHMPSGLSIESEVPRGNPPSVIKEGLLAKLQEQILIHYKLK